MIRHVAPPWRGARQVDVELVESHGRVLCPHDALGAERPHRLDQALILHRTVDPGHHTVEESDPAELEEHADRLAAGVANDLAERRVRRVGVDPGRPHRRRVGPDSMVVGGEEGDGPVGARGVEPLGPAEGVRQDRRVVTPTDDPPLVPVLETPRPERLECAVEGGDPGEVEFEPVGPGMKGMGVAVPEGREEWPTVEIDDPVERRRPGVGVEADGNDPAAGNGNRVATRLRRRR